MAAGVAQGVEAEPTAAHPAQGVTVEMEGF
jgi:hypothetical protein